MNDFVTMMLQASMRTLAVIPLQELRDHVKSCENSIEYADSMGVMRDPSGWMAARKDGSMEDAKHQLKVAKRRLGALEALHERESFIQSLTQEEDAT